MILPAAICSMFRVIFPIASWGNVDTMIPQNRNVQLHKRREPDRVGINYLERRVPCLSCGL